MNVQIIKFTTAYVIKVHRIKPKIQLNSLHYHCICNTKYIECKPDETDFLLTTIVRKLSFIEQFIKAVIFIVTIAATFHSEEFL